MKSVCMRVLPWAGLTLLALLCPRAAHAAPTVFTDSGDILDQVNAFRAALGDLNPNEPGERPAGRREINWDAVPDAFTNVDSFPGDFFAFNAAPRARGAVFSSATGQFRVSSDNFAGVNGAYAQQFNFFSASKTFQPINTNTMDVTFRVAGASTPASVSGFGVVFSDVDRKGAARLEFFSGGVSLGTFEAPVRSDAGGLSFVGVVFQNQAAVTRVRITSGEAALGANVNDLSLNRLNPDLVIMDDFIYGEPHADSDQDGVFDRVDRCRFSDTRTYVDVNGAALGQTTVNNFVDSRGCTIQDLVNSCRRSVASQTSFSTCIRSLATSLQRAGIITATQSAELIRNARWVR